MSDDFFTNYPPIYRGLTKEEIDRDCNMWRWVQKYKKKTKGCNVFQVAIAAAKAPVCKNPTLLVKDYFRWRQFYAMRDRSENLIRRDIEEGRIEGVCIKGHKPSYLVILSHKTRQFL